MVKERRLPMIHVEDKAVQLKGSEEELIAEFAYIAAGLFKALHECNVPLRTPSEIDKILMTALMVGIHSQAPL